MIAHTSQKAPRVLCANTARTNRRLSLSASRRILRKTLHHKRSRQPPAIKKSTVQDDVCQKQSPASPIPAHSFRLPCSLPRPLVGEVSRQPIEAIDPALVPVPTEYIRDNLVPYGTDMLAAVANVRAQPPTSSLPRELEIIVNDMVALACPTHMLAVYGHSTTMQKRKVTLFPTHHLILAAHCANLPSLPISKPDVTKDTTQLPVFPICLPSPETFSILQSYLYTKRIDNLLASLLPATTSSLSEEATSVSEMINPLSRHLAATGNMSSLARHSMIINGVWRNACALGVRDDKLWEVIGASWEVVVGAMGQLQSQH